MNDSIYEDFFFLIKSMFLTSLPFTLLLISGLNKKEKSKILNYALAGWVSLFGLILIGFMIFIGGLLIM